MPSRASTLCRKRAAASSLPGGLLVSIRTYCWSKQLSSAAMAARSSVVARGHAAAVLAATPALATAPEGDGAEAERAASAEAPAQPNNDKANARQRSFIAAL